VVLLCYLLARNLTAPLRVLQRAVYSVGRGDFSARVGLNRRDEFGRLGRAFDDMAERIETLLQAERRLLADISHELRSPLARLSVAVELARSAEDPEPALNRIQKESERLNDLVGELLEVTRAEGDPSSRRREPFCLDDILREIADDASLEAEARGCFVRLETPDRTPFEGDPELMRRAVENVVRNAIRYAPEGTAVEISLTGRTIRVRDYGPGVPEESLTRIFDAFYRVETDRDRASGGAGLGLAIARRAVEIHGGALHARNAHPGLEVEISLPPSSQHQEHH
jgi:two-component system sensor histidine kinase CpxA